MILFSLLRLAGGPNWGLNKLTTKRRKKGKKEKREKNTRRLIC